MEITVETIKKKLRLSNNQFIGLFTQETDSEYKITDIRNTDFVKIEDKEKGIKNLSISFKHLDKKFHQSAYYTFSWILLGTEPLQFGIDLNEEITIMSPKDIINCLYNGIMQYTAGAAKNIAHSLDTLKKQLTQSGKEVFIYELLQNANDYPKKKKIGNKIETTPVEVEFHITEKYLIFQHTGEYFNPKNIAAVCDINDGEKSNNTEAIGYKGIGFKTVFLDNDYVYLNTGEYSFRFDKNATDVINTPWQILPIWTQENELHQTIKDIFHHSNDQFRVKFALQPRNEEILTNESRTDNYINLFSEVFSNERVILFIPNIQKVSIFLKGRSEPIIREKNSKNWCVSESLITEIPEDITKKINDTLDNPNALRSDGYEKIPEKYYNFKKTAIKFACKKEGRKLIPIDNAILYCYLPAKKTNWGFKFLINTDMVPNGQRDDIEDIELNHEITKIAGKQFFYWIKSLIESQEYEYDSIFSLIPNFQECKRINHYSQFVEEFQNEFEKLIREEAFVPVIDKDGNYTTTSINNIINDRTYITTYGVMSDNDFLTLLGHKEGYLPIKELRNSESFKEFLYRHSPADYDINFNNVVAKCETEDFQKWLKDFDNNQRFITHCLEKNKLNEFAAKAIFVEYGGGLFSAGNLYYNFEEKCNKIKFLRNYIAHLSPESRKIFETNEKWSSFAEKYFNHFDATKMIERYIVPCDEAIALLNDLDNSILFYHYLTENNVDLKDYSSKIPYITEDGIPCTDYSCYKYLFSDDAYLLSKETWLGDNTIKVLSKKYFDGIDDENKNLLNTFFTRLGFQHFDKTQFVTEVLIKDSTFKNNINNAIEKDFTINKSFVEYVFKCDISLKELSLKDYTLSCIDLTGEYVYLNNDDVRFFDQEAHAQNSTYAENKAHKWLKSEMMYALNNAYFIDCDEDNRNKLISFIRQQFGIKTFTDKSFFLDVVHKNRTTIYDSLSNKESMIAFLDYLKGVASRVFDDTMSFNNIKDMPLLCSDGTILKSRDAYQLYEYDDEGISTLNSTWCPNIFVILDKVYTDFFSQDVRQLFKITKYEVNSVLVSILNNDTFQQTIKSSEVNLDFWRWVKTNRNHIQDFTQLKTIQLLDQNNVLSPACALYISDSYQNDKLESLVTRYVKAAQFVSSDYIKKISDYEKNEWAKLFKKLGLKSDNKDILFSDILPNLSSFEEDSVIAMMTKHIKDLREKWTEKRDQIMELRIKTRSGEYKTLNQAIIVNINEEQVNEPFKYIVLSNEVDPDIFKNNKELLLLISKEYNDINLISEKRIWIKEKIKEYINKFDQDTSNVKDIHIQFVRELAKLLPDYDIDIDLRKQIKYQTKDAEVTYKSASELTLGTAYSPICDFEANGVDNLSYLSDDYLFEDNKDIIKSYFKGEGFHQNMKKDDLQYLSNRRFACYFWSYCFSRRIAEYEQWVNEGRFSNLVCIPTTSSVEKPENLYSPKITAGYAYRAKVPNWKEKVPYKEIVDKIEDRTARELFEKLHFRNKLSFEDCLHYLVNVNDYKENETERRKTIIDWILSSPQHEEEFVNKYRINPAATWRNGKNQKKHIKDLYAIHPEAKQEKDIFWGNEFVLNTSSFPDDIDSFEKICDILKIKILKREDFRATPINKQDETSKMIAILRPKILVLAAIENHNKFKQLYEQYNEKISRYHFSVCEKIDLEYETIHDDVLRIYEDKTHLYYVNSWIHHRTFIKFCESIKKLIGCSVTSDVCEDIFDNNNPIETSISKYCLPLSYDSQFRSYLKSLDLSIDVEEEAEPEFQPSDYYADANDTELSNKEENYSTDNTYEFLENNTNKANSNNTEPIKKDFDHTEPIAKPKEISNKKEKNSANDSYKFINDDEVSDNDFESLHKNTKKLTKSKSKNYDPDQEKSIGSIKDDKDYQPLGDIPYKPKVRKHPKPFTKEEVNRLRSQSSPLELESLPATEEEIDLLKQCSVSPEQIADTNYLAKLRLYFNLKDIQKEEPEESMEEFVHNAKDVTIHKLKDGRYVHACSASRGVMYISPSVWSKMVDDKCKICVYLNGSGKNFYYINTAEEFLNLVNKDDVVIKITGKEKTEVVNALYSGLLKDVKGTAYTLIRVASRTDMDAVFANYVGSMAEPEDGNDDLSEY